MNTISSIQKLLIEAEKEDVFMLLHNNGIKFPYNGFRSVLAMGSSFELNSSLHTILDLEKHLSSNSEKYFGFFTYDFKNQLHQITSQNIRKFDFPDFYFFKPKKIINDFNLPYNAEDNDITNKSNFNIKCNFTKNEYIETIKKIQNDIINGEYYELNFCIEFSIENIEINPINTFLKLNNISPTPFAGLVKFYNQYLICCSPERFLKKENEKLIAQPIKGTIHKGKTTIETEINKNQLLNSEKERAENLMIVDLMRNDLAMSSVVGTTHVEELFGIYEFNHVIQMISTVTSLKKPEISNLKAIINAFPMGSMTGAPKMNVMKHIDMYEKNQRSLYSGAIGFFDENENFDFNVVIRSIIYDDKAKKLSFQVGSAITFDSIPESEYEECFLKAKAIFKTLNIDEYCYE